MARRRPNILLFFPDQHRFDWLGTTPGLPVRTPNLDQTAQRGVRFTHALTPSPLCAPARACLASGKEYARCGVPSNAANYPLDQTTFYSLLRASGYWVASCGKLDLNKPDLNTGVDGRRFLKQWGFSDGINNLGKWDAVRAGAVTPTDPYMAYLHKRGLAATYVADMRKRAYAKHAASWPSPLPDDAYCDNWIARNGLKLMRRFPKDRPWCLMINFAGPHDPWDVTRRMWEWWRGVNFPPPNGSDGYSQEANNGIRRNYSAMVENIDRWVGIYLQELRKRGELENTLVVYSSDHGEMLGDHGLWSKRLPYQPSAGVPLIVAGPGVQRNVVSDAPVSTMDLAATFLDYGGVARPQDMDSRTFRPLLEGRTRHHRDWVLSGLGPWRLSFNGRYKLIDGYPAAAGTSRIGDAPYRPAADRQPPVLFDLQQDPRENNRL
ncbi:MAG TPA: sulfatase-like hydrolase/transferase [Terriglobia bacterium]|nr:sulfatase-like hydrolase/transferase [Terriglobia bacterium]